MFARFPENKVLHQELDIADATAPLFQVKVLCVTAVQFFAHARPHVQYVVAQCVETNAVGEGLFANAIEFPPNHFTTGDRSRTKQCLVLPGPGVFLLVAFERVRTRNEQPFASTWPQASVDVVQDSGIGVRGQIVYESAHQSREK